MTNPASPTPNQLGSVPGECDRFATVLRVRSGVCFRLCGKRPLDGLPRIQPDNAAVFTARVHGGRPRSDKGARKVIAPWADVNANKKGRYETGPCRSCVDRLI